MLKPGSSWFRFQCQEKVWIQLKDSFQILYSNDISMPGIFYLFFACLLIKLLSYIVYNNLIIFRPIMLKENFSIILGKYNYYFNNK